MLGYDKVSLTKITTTQRNIINADAQLYIARRKSGPRVNNFSKLRYCTVLQNDRNSLWSCISEVERKEPGLGSILAGRLQCWKM